MHLTRRVPYRLHVLLGVVLATGLGLATWFLFPKAIDSREIALSTAASSWTHPIAPTEFDASSFCAMWTGQPSQMVDCRSGYNVTTLRPLQSDQSEIAWTQALQSVAQRQVVLRSLLSHLDKLRLQQPLLTQPVFALRWRLDRWAEQAQKLANRTQNRSAQMADYADMFQLLLEQEGQSYDAVSSTFKTINWHVVRSADNPSALRTRANLLETYLWWAPIGATLTTALLLGLGWWRARWLGWSTMAGYASITWLGMLIVADASVNFGQGSNVFPLNPLGNQLNRQVGVGLISVLTISLGLLLAPWPGRLIEIATRQLGMTMLGFTLFTCLAYALQGPALGSEALKLGTAVMGGLMTSAFGRGVHVTGHLAPEALNPWRLIQSWRQNNDGRQDPIQMISAELSRPLLQFTGFCAAGVGTAVLVFNDFGAALVTAMVALTALYMVFGSRIAGMVLLLGGLMAAIMSQTDKVQGRIALMLDPLHASVSDFARLLAFSKATYGDGFPMGKIQWCSGSGVCIPLQALSDYMPVVLTGVIGTRGTYLYFCIYLLVILGLMAWLMRQFLTQQGTTRAMSMMAFFMLWGTALQTAVTFLGNWRIIPLTGLGTPLMSIGLSSALVPVIALTLVLLVRHQTQETHPC